MNTDRGFEFFNPYLSVKSVVDFVVLCAT